MIVQFFYEAGFGKDFFIFFWKARNFAHQFDYLRTNTVYLIRLISLIHGLHGVLEENSKNLKEFAFAGQIYVLLSLCQIGMQVQVQELQDVERNVYDADWQIFVFEVSIFID